MKVKQRGPNADWKIDITCKLCKSVITLESSEDLFARTERVFDNEGFAGFTPATYHFNCPVCEHENRVPSRLIRADIKEEIIDEDLLRRRGLDDD